MSLVGKAWVAMNGAKTYMVAIATGDIAEEGVAMCRFEGWCMQCPSVTHRSARLSKEGTEVYYCGPELVDNTDKVLPTCGCLVGVTVEGIAEPGGKTVVRSQKCPQGRW